MTDTVPHRVAKPQLSPVEEWGKNWFKFKQALGDDIYGDFNQWIWIKLLLTSGIKCLLYRMNLDRTVKVGRDYTGHVSQLVPFVAIGLVCVVVLFYFISLHQPIIIERWCNCDAKDENTQEANRSVVDGEPQSCLWSSFHAGIVVYLATMILWNYTRTVFVSPGVALPSQSGDGSERTEGMTQISDSNAPISSPFKWRSVETRGGCCYLSPILSIKEERCRVALYDGAGEEDWASSEGIVYIPSPQTSYCGKCRMNRPPRCHHCSSCNRCVLQMDHHCLWMNNCIGYNNYRSFVLAIGYLAIGCCYGIFMLAMPFYELIKEQVHQYGLHFFYKNKTGFLDLPMPWVILIELWENGAIKSAIVIKVVFPLLVFVEVFLIILLRSHVKFICKAMSTLEHMTASQVLKGKFDLRSHKVHAHRLKEKTNQNECRTQREARIVNPFDQGISSNFRQVFGSNIIFMFLPVPVSLPKPYIPNCKYK